MIDLGTGSPIVLIPGIQGRWEWMRPAFNALARRCRVMTFSLRGERSSGALDPALGFDNFVAQIDDVLDRAGLESATLCGVSFGGWVAVRYAAVRPHRVRGLVLVSALGPSWQPDFRIHRYVRAPRLFAPIFALRSPFRLGPEVFAALPRPRDRLAFAMRHTARVIAAPFSSRRMAERVRLASTVNVAGDCARVTAPTLVVTGEPHLDKVVSVAGTREYLERIAGARAAVIERTGHIGLVTRPERFAEIISEFVETTTEVSRAGDVRRRA